MSPSSQEQQKLFVFRWRWCLVHSLLEVIIQWQSSCELASWKQASALAIRKWKWSSVLHCTLLIPDLSSDGRSATPFCKRWDHRALKEHMLNEERDTNWQRNSYRNCSASRNWDVIVILLLPELLSLSTFHEHVLLIRNGEGMVLPLRLEAARSKLPHMSERHCSPTLRGRWSGGKWSAAKPWEVLSGRWSQIWGHLLEGLSGLQNRCSALGQPAI